MKYAIGIAALIIVIATVAIGVATNAAAQTSPCVSGGAVPSGNDALASDCENMLAFKDALRGTAALNWSANTRIGSWDGVRTGGSPARVTVIRLQKRELDGSIPTGIGDLDQLTDLWLYTNDLTGPLPAEIGNLSELNTLMLAWNDLSGQIPLSLNDLSLDRLWLRGNGFTGCMPANLLEVPDGDAAQLNLPTCQDGQTPTPQPPGTTPVPPTAIPTPPPSTGGDTAQRLTAIESRLTALESRVSAIEATATPVPPPPEVSPPSDSPPVGSTVEAGDSTYRVNEFLDPAPVNENWEVEEGFRLVAADITQTAVEEDRYSEYDFSVQDGDGYVYDARGILYADLEPPFGVGTLDDGEVHRGWVNFVVPEDAVLITVRVEYEYDEPVVVIADLTAE